MVENTLREDGDAKASGVEADDSARRSAKRAGKRWPIALGVIAVVLVIAGSGFFVWHEQPGFCNAICHTPMDPYLPTYEQEVGHPGVDKWGNEVNDTAGMLAPTHREQGVTCMGCHIPTLGEQVSEGMSWVTGDYEVKKTSAGALVPTEKDLAQLTAARDVSSDEFCLNERCHNMTRDDLIAATSDMEFNPHVPQHKKAECSDCHKAHRQSVMTCTQCHADAEVPAGWLSVKEANALS